MKLSNLISDIPNLPFDSLLSKYKKHFKYIVVENECRKWFKWVTRNETPFPCVCLLRNEDCIFAETYYELSKVCLLYTSPSPRD